MTTAKLNIGTELLDKYGIWTVTSIKEYGYEVRGRSGMKVVFHDQVKYYELL